MTELLDVELLKDLRGLGKPPSFDGNDTDNQEIRFSVRIHMSLVSTVSHTWTDKCEAERNPIILAGVKALGEAHLKCCMQNADVSLVGSDHERKSPNPCLIC